MSLPHFRIPKNERAMASADLTTGVVEAAKIYKEVVEGLRKLEVLAKSNRDHWKGIEASTDEHYLSWARYAAKVIYSFPFKQFTKSQFLYRKSSAKTTTKIQRFDSS